MKPKARFRGPLPGKTMDVWEEIAWQSTLSRRQFQVLKALRDLGGKKSVKKIAEKMDCTSEVVAKILYVLESKKKVVRASKEQGVRTIWRLRTWADVDRDNIREMARRGGVL